MLRGFKYSLDIGPTDFLWHLDLVYTGKFYVKRLPKSGWKIVGSWSLFGKFSSNSW